MSDPVSLLFGVHAHQPADNFPEVLDRADELCYRPFLETLDACPRFRFAFHCSGPLYTILCERFPHDLRLLERMIARGQVELFGGGDAEPLLAAIPERDRRGQLARFSDRLEAHFGVRPRGAWLTERAWEATVVSALVDCGFDYATVDDYHFLCTGREPRELTGYFTTEEGGRRLDLFPISEVLRYRIPFAPAADVVTYLEALADSPGTAAIYFDDIEKFGIWPETHEWVYGRRWLAEFLDRVLASKRIVTRGYGDFHDEHRTRGIVYLPSTAYIEMNEWTLPAKAAASYADLVERERGQGRYEDVKPFLRGGIWRNFLSRYPEANWLHKRMLGLSARLDALPAARANPALTGLLYAAQANDAYWHGLFGGLYLPHLRRGIYRALLALEHALDRIDPRAPRAIEDHDGDGIDEIFLVDDTVQAVLRDDGTGALVELDSYALLQNLGDTLRRHAESYHRAIRDGGDRRDAPAEGIASAHDRVTFRHPVAPEDIVPDARGRTLFVDRLEPPDGAPITIDRYALINDTDGTPAAHFRATLETVGIDKLVALREGRLDVTYRMSGTRSGRFVVELDLALPSCDGMGGRFIHDDVIRGGFGDEYSLRTERIVLDDMTMGGRIDIACTPPAQIDARPYRTVSQSEQGFEKIMQSFTLMLAWPLDDAPVECKVSLTMSRGQA